MVAATLRAGLGAAPHTRENQDHSVHEQESIAIHDCRACQGEPEPALDGVADAARHAAVRAH